MNSNLPSTDGSVRERLVQVVNRIRTDSGRSPLEVSDEHTLSEQLDLDSLDLAVLVVQAEQQLGVDPFRQRTSGVRTFGDLVRLYQQAVAHRESSA
jgi:acyl carrier protein